MSNEFQIGDWVECVDNHGYEHVLQRQELYKIKDIIGGFIYITNTQGRVDGFHVWRFQFYDRPQITPEQHVKEFLKRLEYVLDKDNTTFGRIECWQHQQGVIVLPSDVADIMGVDDIYTYINNSYDQLTSQAAQKRKLELLDKKAKLDVELAEINKELEGL